MVEKGEGGGGGAILLKGGGGGVNTLNAGEKGEGSYLYARISA